MSAWMIEHTLEDRGFFRTVEPLRVLEVAFNNIMRSGRHASGFALRFPRILRIRTDKPVSEIDTVERVEKIYRSQVDKPSDIVSTLDSTVSLRFPLKSKESSSVRTLRLLALFVFVIPSILLAQGVPP